MNGELFLIYTLEEGGRFQARYSTVAEYQDAKTNQRLDVSDPAADSEANPQYIKPELIVLCKVERHHDFVLARLTGSGDRDKPPLAAIPGG